MDGKIQADGDMLMRSVAVNEEMTSLSCRHENVLIFPRFCTPPYQYPSKNEAIHIVNIIASLPKSSFGPIVISERKYQCACLKICFFLVFRNRSNMT